MTLTEFLLARIAEDERRVESVRDFIPDEGDQGEYIDPARALAECEAKRRIVAKFPHAADGDGWNNAGEEVLLELATIYADHPDYNEAWRP